MATMVPLCACTALRKTSRAVSRLYDEAVADAGLSIVQFAILRAIARAAPVPLSRLADDLVMERTSLYRALAPLEQAGLVKITAGGKGRSRSASLTSAGEDRIAQATHGWETTQQAFVDKLGQEQWQQLYTLLAEATAIAGVGRSEVRG